MSLIEELLGLSDFVYGDLLAEAATQLEAMQAEIDRLREALTPSADTKAAYIGESKFSVRDGYDEQDEEIFRDVLVPWDTTKEIMAAISARASLDRQGK